MQEPAEIAVSPDDARPRMPGEPGNHVSSTHVMTPVGRLEVRFYEDGGWAAFGEDGEPICPDYCGETNEVGGRVYEVVAR